MDKPTFAHSSPNYDEHTNAVECAARGDFEGACEWLNQGQTALEYLENSEDYETAADFVLSSAKEAAVKLSRDKATWPERWTS